METKVNLAATQEGTASDFNAISDLTEVSVDAIVRELLFDEARYTGFSVSKVDSMNLTVATGRLYAGGKVFRAEAATSLSVTSLLPTSGSRIVLVVVSGATVDTAVETRRFLVSTEPRVFQPKPTATRKSRQASVELVAGTIAASPSRPAVPAGALVVASMVVGPAGIDGSISGETSNAALSLEKAVGSINTLSGQLRLFNSQMTTLRSDIAGLARTQTGKADMTRLRAIENSLFLMREKLDLPDTQAIDGYDDFTTASETDVANPANTSEIEAGRMVFGKVEKTRKMVALLNPSDPKVDKTVSGLIMPASIDTLRIECDDKDGEVAISSYQVVTTELKRRSLGRWWYWYAWWSDRLQLEDWFRGNSLVRLYDPSADLWEDVDLRLVRWSLVGQAVRNRWKLWVDGAYWDRGTVTRTFTGARLCQTFLCAQSGWHKRIDLGFTSVGPTGDVHVAICGLTDTNTPDENHVLETVTVPVGSLKTWPAWTPVQFDPVYLERGERYGILITTTGNHKLGVSTSNDLTNGVLQTWVGGSVWSYDLAKDAVFRLYGCRFSQTAVIVDIEDITLTGGIAEVQTILTGYEPKGTNLTVQARISGVWRSLDETDETVLAGGPTQLPLRFVFQGTKDLMPAIDLSKSAIVVSRPRSSSVHISTARTLPAGVTTATVHVIEEAVGFAPAKHGWTVALLSGAAFDVVHAAASFVDKALPNGRKRRTWTFTGLPAIAAYKVRTTTTTTDTSAFDVDYRRDWAL
jgi:hypothetical protein